MQVTRKDLRNIAIIAHVDHGKTTLVDGMLKQAKTFRENQQVAERVMDSNELERERGITILAKNTSIKLHDAEANIAVKINIVDTPGHADFGAEVERVMNMVDGVLLLIDAAEGPMPQTRFVLKKALEMKHRVVVVINKVDRRGADPVLALNQTFDLFIQLGASDQQADFPVIYTNAVCGQAGLTPELGPDLKPLFEAILRHIPAPNVDADAPFQMLVTTLGYDSYRGGTASGRIRAGQIQAGMPVMRITAAGEQIAGTARYLYLHEGLERSEVESVSAGDIVVIAGLDDIAIGETLADIDHPLALPTIHVEEPTVRMTFGVNTSPFAGREGTWGTSRKLRERLYNELRTNVALRVEDSESADQFIVSGRGELHLAILIETMRREGYEFQISRPEVILHSENGTLLEPFEELYIETTPESVGLVLEMLAKRRGQMLDLQDNRVDSVRLRYMIPTRGLLGFRHHLLTATRGAGFMHSIFHDYLPVSGDLSSSGQGSLVAWEPGTTTSYGLHNAEERGSLFVGAGIEVYEGMVIGENQRPGDLTVNVCKKRHVTNHRASFKEIDERLTPPRLMSLDEAIEYLHDDELLEVTPDSLRLRKRMLDTNYRNRETKRSREAVSV
ncbi:MAG: translational GTPase TypA [Anaerolineales bacterium]|nr:MAG: translational GTPase TypA [Anaerolineales bacterium]